MHFYSSDQTHSLHLGERHNFTVLFATPRDVVDSPRVPVCHSVSPPRRTWGHAPDLGLRPCILTRFPDDWHINEEPRPRGWEGEDRRSSPACNWSSGMGVGGGEALPASGKGGMKCNYLDHQLDCALSAPPLEC